MAAITKCGVDSIVVNSTINTKILSKKLRLGAGKCHQMHIGENHKWCPTLKVNKRKDNQIMEKVNEDTYLGGLISNACDNTKKLEKATNKGFSIISGIMAMLQEISFGKHYFEIAKILRESLFINGVLWNMETWYDIKEKEIDEIEKIDRILLRRILNVPTSTPSALLYLEMGVIPLRYILQARRLMFLQYILKRKNDDLLLKFFNAQTREPCKNDWSNTVKKDLEELGLEFNFEEIKLFSKSIWLKKVKEACKISAFENLLETQMDYSKGSNIGYGKLMMRSYLKSKKISSNQARIIFKIRTRMMKVKNNFRNGASETKCSVCKDGEDSQVHIFMECKQLGERLTKKEYLIIFSEDDDEIARIINKIQKIYNMHKNFTENQ